MAIIQDLSCYAGETFSKLFSIKDSTGTLVSQTGGTVYFTIKETKDTADADADIKKVISGTGNQTTISIANTETDDLLIGTEKFHNYVYSLQYYHTDGTFKTYFTGKFRVELNSGLRVKP